MIITPASPPRIERGRFRTRSADADWDFFPFEIWGRGYRVNEKQRENLLRCVAWIFKPAAFLICILSVVALAGRFVDYMDELQVLLLAGAAVTPLVLYMIAEWLYVRRLPPAERPLTLREIHGFLALTQARSRTMAELALGSIGTAVFAGGLLLEITSGHPWPRIAVSAYCVVVCVYLAWRAYHILSLRLR
jgi:hypothetical protein